MLYNTIGDAGIKLSAISFGAMRWPSEQACHDIINHGLDLGLNYVDTSTGYVGGQSERWTGQAVARRRGEILFSSKCAFGRAPRADEVRRSIDASLAATGLECFDFYQLWGLQADEQLREALAKGGFVEGVRRAQADGLVRLGLGFTFHGPADLFRAAVDSGHFLCATVSYNLMNRKEEEQIVYAAAHGVGIIVMNPLGGGVLALAGDRSLDFLRDGERGPHHNALRFLLANRGITSSIVGFRAVEEVDQAVAALAGADALTEGFRRGLAARMDAVQLSRSDLCTGCGYCKDCPQGSNPSKFMQAMRDFIRYSVSAGDLERWIWSQYPHADPIKDLQLCSECGQCEQKCPQHLQIVEHIRRAKKAML